MYTSTSVIHGGPHRRRGGGGEDEFPCQSTLHRQSRILKIAPGEGEARPGEREEEEEGNGGPPRRRASGVSSHLREAHPRVCVSEGDE